MGKRSIQLPTVDGFISKEYRGIMGLDTPDFLVEEGKSIQCFQKKRKMK